MRNADTKTERASEIERKDCPASESCNRYNVLSSLASGLEGGRQDMGRKCRKVELAAHRVVHDALEGLQEDQDVGGLAASDPVIVVVLSQLVDLLQRQAGAHAPQVRSDVKALIQHTAMLTQKYTPA